MEPHDTIQPSKLRQRQAFLLAEMNPFQDQLEVARKIEEAGGRESPLARREYFGEWAPLGERIWVRYSPKINLVDWAARNVALNGWQNLTPSFAAELFYGYSDSAGECKEIGGQDYNCRPMNLIVGKIIAREGCDHREPKNWVLYIEDEVIKNALTTDEFAVFLAHQAGDFAGRGLPKDYYAGLHIVADATGFFDGSRAHANNGTADALTMAARGFISRAPMYHNGTPRNPNRNIRRDFVNQLLGEGRLLINRRRCPTLIESLDNETYYVGIDHRKDRPTGGRHDRMAGPTDAVGYLAYAALFEPSSEVRKRL